MSVLLLSCESFVAFIHFRYVSGFILYLGLCCLLTFLVRKTRVEAHHAIQSFYTAVRSSFPSLQPGFRSWAFCLNHPELRLKIRRSWSSV